MILNISLTVIDSNIDSSLILDFFILDLLSFRNDTSVLKSPELVGIVVQKGGFRWGSWSGSVLSWSGSVLSWSSWSGGIFSWSS